MIGNIGLLANNDKQECFREGQNIMMQLLFSVRLKASLLLFSAFEIRVKLWKSSKILRVTSSRLFLFGHKCDASAPTKCRQDSRSSSPSSSSSSSSGTRRSPPKILPTMLRFVIPITSLTWPHSGQLITTWSMTNFILFEAGMFANEIQHKVSNTMVGNAF